MIKGIDISQIQGVIDFAAVAATGVEFVICRCGVGNNGSDSMYATNIANAQAAGLKVAAYHFLFPLPTTAAEPTRSPTAQAHAHFAVAGNVPVVFADLEWPVSTDWAKWGCSAAQITQWVVDYLEAYEAISGVRPIVYTYPSFAQSIKLPASFAQKYKLWIASYETTPSIPAPWTDWVVWQNSGGTSHLPNGAPVDTDFVRDLYLWETAIVAPIPDDPAPVAPDPVITPIPLIPDPPVAIQAPPANTVVSNGGTIASIWLAISKLFS